MRGPRSAGPRYDAGVVRVRLRPVALSLTVAMTVQAQERLRPPVPHQRTAQEVSVWPEATQRQQRAAGEGLELLSLTRPPVVEQGDAEGRVESIGFSLQVHTTGPRWGEPRLYSMPVFRSRAHPDSRRVPPDAIELVVGNELPASSASPLPLRPIPRRVTLREYLGRFRRYLSRPASWPGPWTSLLAERDSEVVLRAQVCPLAVDSEGRATYTPVVIARGQRSGAPGTLVILATPYGTSATILTGDRDGFFEGRVGGQRLYENRQGERATLRFGPEQSGGADPDRASGLGFRSLYLIEVPLLKSEPEEPPPVSFDGYGPGDFDSALFYPHDLTGEFAEVDGREIHRDARQAIRVTVLFYWPIRTSLLRSCVLGELATHLDRVQEKPALLGRLVADGAPGVDRGYGAPLQEPPARWHEHWMEHEFRTGQTRMDAMCALRSRFGPAWFPESKAALQAALAQLEQAR